MFVYLAYTNLAVILCEVHKHRKKLFISVPASHLLSVAFNVSI